MVALSGRHSVSFESDLGKTDKFDHASCREDAAHLVIAFERQTYVGGVTCGITHTVAQIIKDFQIFSLYAQIIAEMTDHFSRCR